jgi:transcriptional regulator with XRE-family HTH domain
MASSRGQASLGARVKALRQARGLSQVDLARLIGRHQTAIGPYERDEYTPSRQIVMKLAEVLETSPEYLYFGRTPARLGMPLVGRIIAGGLLAAGRTRPEPLLELREEQLTAMTVEDDSMAPVLRPGQVALVASQPVRDPTHLLGRDVLAELRDGRSLLRRLLPGAEPNRFDLAAYNASTLRDVAVAAVRPVLGVLASEAFSTPAVAHG